MNPVQPAPVRYPADEPQIGPKKPGPRPSDCPWCNTPNCNHCRCPGYPKCDHAPNTLCSRPRYKRRLVCNPCEKHKLTKTTKKNKKSSESIVVNSNENNEPVSPALSPREKLSHEFGKTDCPEASNAVITPPALTVESSLLINNPPSSNGMSAVPFVPDPSYQELIYIKEVNSERPSSVISIHKYTDHLSDVRRYIETYLWDIYQRNEFKFCDKNSNNENNNKNIKNSNKNHQNNNNKLSPIREIKLDQEAFTYAWDNTIEMKYPHHAYNNILITIRVIQIIYIDPSKSRKRIKKESNILPYSSPHQQQQQQLIDPILSIDDIITPTTPPSASSLFANNNNNSISSMFIPTSTNPLSNLINFPVLQSPPPPSPPQPSSTLPSSFNHHQQQQQQQHITVRTIPLPSHGEMFIRSPAGSSLSNTSYGFGRNRSSNDLTSFTNVLTHYNNNTISNYNNNNNNNNNPAIINNSSNSNRNSVLQQEGEEPEWC